MQDDELRYFFNAGFYVGFSVCLCLMVIFIVAFRYLT